jgi:hypothetical protein
LNRLASIRPEGVLFEGVEIFAPGWRITGEHGTKFHITNLPSKQFLFLHQTGTIGTRQP